MNETSDARPDSGTPAASVQRIQLASTLLKSKEVKLPTLLTTAEAAEYLRCHRATLNALWHARKLRKTKVGSRAMWRRSELDAYLDRQTRAAR
jgi:excisionase family DNA binding protein